MFITELPRYFGLDCTGRLVYPMQRVAHSPLKRSVLINFSIPPFFPLLIRILITCSPSSS